MHKKDKGTRLVHFTANILIVAVIAALGIIMSGARYKSAYDVCYKTQNTDSLAIECVLAWNSSNTERLLDILRENDARISFVISGNSARENPSLVRKIASQGHGILTCGMNYEDAGVLDEKSLCASISESCEAFSDIGVGVRGFYCATDDTQKAARASKSANLPCVRCTVDLLCARGGAESLTQRAYYAIDGGNIVAVTPTGALCDALPDILGMVREKSLSVTGF